MSKPRALPFDVSRHVANACLCLHVQRAARALARCFDEAFRPLDLTSGQFSLLMSLNRPAPASIGTIAAFLAMDRTTLTAALKPLERRGLIAIGIDPSDRRSRLLSLTPAGMALLLEAIPLWEKAHASVEAMTADADRLRADLIALSQKAGN